MAVINEKFEKVELKDFQGSWLVLFFFPFDFTFVCPTEVCLACSNTDIVVVVVVVYSFLFERTWLDPKLGYMINLFFE